MILLRKLCLALTLSIATIGLAACDDGPAENAGEKLDRAVENMGDAVNPKGPAERAGEAVDNAAERAGEAMENAGENIQRQAQ